MQYPDFEAIAFALNGAEPIQAYLTPYRVFTLVGLLQLALRHPKLVSDIPNVAEVAESMARNLIEKLGEIDPVVATTLEMGWTQDMDTSHPSRNVVEVHNVYALYERNRDGSLLKKPLVMLCRPEDWGDRSRWYYHRCKLEFELNGTLYIKHCHVYNEVDRTLPQTLAAYGETLFWAIRPGTPEQLCGLDFLSEDDYWFDEWGKTPPVYRSAQDDEDPIVLFDPVDGPITDSQLRKICEDVEKMGQ